MREFIANLLQAARVEITLWRNRNARATVAEFLAAFDEACVRFPNDRLVQEADARAELAVRRILGRRVFDA